MRVTYHPRAQTELIEAGKYYSTRNPKIGGEFLDSIDAAASTVGEDPQRNREILPDRVRILAVKHHSRDESYWRGRLEQ